MAEFTTPERPRFSLGPKPRTARGKRRHEARDKSARLHAEGCWQDREDYLHFLGSRTYLQKYCG